MGTSMIDTRNSILIAAVLFVLAVVGLYVPYIQDRNRELPDPSRSIVAEDADITVHYTNRGFEPKTITIRTGTTVDWIDTSDKLMWVASDPHPSHTNLGGFDERGIEGNVFPPEIQSSVPTAHAHTGVHIFRYTFSEIGSWDYHNHLVPQDRGTVIVEP